MKHHIVQNFQQPNLVTMPGTHIPMYANQGIELVTLEKEKSTSQYVNVKNQVTGVSKIKKKEARRARYLACRLFMFNLLERPRTWFAMLYHSFVFILILASLFLSIIMTMENYEKSDTINDGVYYMEVCLVVIFGLEYILRLWSCSSHGNYTGVWGRMRFIKKPYMVIDIIVIVATVVVVATADHRTSYFSVSVFRFLRFLQVLRILRLDRQRGAFKIVSHVVYEHRQELMTCWYMSFILLVACAFLVYLAEKSDDLPAESGEIKDLGEGMYFAIITLLTIGYGDYSPKNWVAKLLTCVFAFVGTAFFALPAGILGSGFALQVAQNQKRKHLNRRRQPAALVIQYAWRVYASRPGANKPATWLQHQVIPAAKEKKFSIYQRSPNGTPTVNRRVPFLRHKFRQHKLSYAEGDGYHSRRSSIGATIPSALELRDRCQSDGNLLLVSPHHVEDHQHTIVSLPPDYAESLNFGKNPLGLAAHSNQDIKFAPLTEMERNAVRFIRKIKFRVSIKKFKEECRPYDVKDVIEQYTEGQLEMFGVIKRFQGRLETTLGVQDEHVEIRPSLNTRLLNVEMKVENIDAKLDQIMHFLRHDRHRHRRHSERSDRSDLSGSAELLDIDYEAGDRSPRERKRGMTLQGESDTVSRDYRHNNTLEADELTQRLERLRHLDSSESSVNMSHDNLQVPRDRTPSRFTVTPTVLSSEMKVSRDIDLNSSCSSVKSDTANTDKVGSLRKCPSCTSKSLQVLPHKKHISKTTSVPSLPSDCKKHKYHHSKSHSNNSLNKPNGDVKQPLSLKHLFNGHEQKQHVNGHVVKSTDQINGHVEEKTDQICMQNLEKPDQLSNVILEEEQKQMNGHVIEDDDDEIICNGNNDTFEMKC